MDESFMKEKPVFPLLISMAFPMVLSMLVNSLYNIVDSFFVAQISEDAMTALSLVYPVQNFISAAGIGFGIGLNAVIAFYLGAGEKVRADLAATLGMVLATVHSIIMTALGIFIMPGFLKMFTSSEHVLDFGIRYSMVAFSFTLALVLGVTFEKIFQAVGNMKITMIGLMSGCVANIILDPLLIFGIGPFPAMGIEGAALATGLGQVLTLGIYLAVYKWCPLGVKLHMKYVRPDRKMIKRLYSIGIPATLNLALPSILITSLNAILAVYSQVYILILGIYYKLQTFLYLPANGLIQGMRPLVGYNYGAGEEKRVRHIYWLVLFMSGMIMLLGMLLCYAAPDRLIALFTENRETIEEGGKALRIISVGFLASAVSVTSSGALEGLGKGIPSLFISLLRYCILLLPAAFVLTRYLGPSAIWHGFWITEWAAGAVSLWIWRKSLKKV